MKHELAAAVLDPDSDVEAVDMLGNMEELRQRLEVLLGARPAAGVDERQRETREQEALRASQRERLAATGGALVAAAFSFLCEALPSGEPTPRATQLADTFRNQLAACLDEDESGRPTLTVKLPDRSSLDALANALGRLLAEHSASAVP